MRTLNEILAEMTVQRSVHDSMNAYINGIKAQVASVFAPNMNPAVNAQLDAIWAEHMQQSSLIAAALTAKPQN